MKYALLSPAALAALLLASGCGEDVHSRLEPPTGPAVSAASVAQLGAYNADIHQTSVSGISSGGFMAVQLHVAFSSIMKGVGVFAGGVYHCAGSSGKSSNAQTACQYNISPPSLSTLTAYTDQQASAGTIDATSNLAGQQVWLFSGTDDYTVYQAEVNLLQKYYQHYVTAGSIFYKNNLAAGHGSITDNYGNSCSATQSPFINNCSYDGPGLLLAQIYGPLNARNTGTLSGQLIQFDQTHFVSNPSSVSLDTTGWVYVPASCAQGAACRVHVALHGCEQNQTYVGSDYYAHAGYNAWADTNNIIVLYPQTVSSSALGNPLGCWDWWGYSNASNYTLKSGAQMAAIKSMLDQLTSGHAALPAPTGLAASNVGDTALTLSWSSVAGAAGYDVFRGAASGGPFSKLNASPLSATSYNDSGLSPGTTYYYQVSATTSAGGDGTPSSVLAVTTTGQPPAIPTPTGLAVGKVTASTVALSWNAAAGVSGYNVYRGTSSGQENTLANPSLITGTSFTDSGLAAQTTYYYVVKAQNSAGNQGPASAEVSATTAAAATCYKASNYAHYAAGRASLCSLVDACADGSGQNMGLLNVFITTTLKETAPGYYVIGTCP